MEDTHHQAPVSIATALVILHRSIVTTSTTSLSSVSSTSASCPSNPVLPPSCGPSICNSLQCWTAHQNDCPPQSSIYYTIHPVWSGQQQEKQGASIEQHIRIKMPHLRPISTMLHVDTSSAPYIQVTTLLPQEEPIMQVHTIVIVVIFCTVCLLLLLAFLYTFCFHCSIQSLPKDQRSNGYSLDREDATYKCSSSECPSVANAV